MNADESEASFFDFSSSIYFKEIDGASSLFRSSCSTKGNVKVRGDFSSFSLVATSGIDCDEGSWSELLKDLLRLMAFLDP